jgi:hypothetical protein
MRSKQLPRLLTIAAAMAALTACTAVDRAVIATENGASRILGVAPTAPEPAAPAVDLQALAWQKLDPARSDLDAAEVAIIDSDAKTGATRVALKLQPGESLPAFWQEAQQTYTVVKGTFVAEGIDSTGQPQRIDQGPGAFTRVPARMIQHLRTKPGSEAVMLVTVYGEWKVNFVEDAARPTEIQRAAN